MSRPSYVLLLCLPSLLAFGLDPTRHGVNVALGKPVAYSPAPNYPRTIGPNDSAKLTDGKSTTGTMWLDPQAVGWMNASPVRMTVDLGSSIEVNEIDLSVGAGTAGVEWPRMIESYGSDDGKVWCRLAELVSPDSIAPKGGYQRAIYRGAEIAKSCRYISILVATRGALYFFSDELQVFGVPTGRHPISASITDPSLDLSTVLIEHAKAMLDRADMEDAAHQADRLGIPRPLRADDLPQAWSRIACAMGLEGVRVWKRDRFGPMGPHDLPSFAEPAPKLTIDVFKGETRGSAFLISNFLEAPATVRVAMSGGRAIPGSVRLAVCPWTTTFDGNRVATAIQYLDARDTGWSYELPPTTTYRFWVEIDGSTLPKGSTRFELDVSQGLRRIGTVPVEVRVSGALLNAPALSVGGWDYVDGSTSHTGLPASAAADYWKLVRDLPVDTACAAYTILPKPTHASSVFDFGKVDRWLEITPNIRQRLLFLNAADRVDDVSTENPAFAEIAGRWIRAISDHITSIDPKCRIMALIVDEPSTEEQAKTILAWQTAIKKYAPAVLVFEDPFFQDVTSPTIRAAIGGCDVLCLNQSFVLADKNRSALYAAMPHNHEVWLYGTMPDPKELDPTAYYRLFAWQAFAEEAKGILYWSFSDNGSSNGESPWHEEANLSHSYSPLFLGSPLATSLQWEALRDGLWDYELLSELRSRTRHTRWEADADRLLKQARVLAETGSGAKPWNGSTREAQAESIRKLAEKLLATAGR